MNARRKCSRRELFLVSGVQPENETAVVKKMPSPGWLGS